MRTEKEILETLIGLMERYLASGVIPWYDETDVEELISDYNIYWKD